MTKTGISRRRVLAVGGTVSLAALAGCSGSSSDGSGGDISAVVPSGADLVVDVDVETLLTDDAVREQYNGALSEIDSGVGQQLTVSRYLDEIQAQFGLDPEKADQLLLYADFEREQAGLVIAAAWSREQVKSAMGATEGSHNGRPLYQSGELAVGVLPDGRYTFGSSESTRNVIDVQQGDADGAGGQIRTAFDSAPEGYVRFALDPPEEYSPPSSGPLELSSFGEIVHGYGSLYRNAGKTGGTLVVEANSSDAATQIEQATTGAIGIGEQAIAEEESLPQELVSVLESTDVSRSGATVRLENDDGRGYLLLVPIAVGTSFFLGLGEGSSSPTPRVNFEGEYDSDQSTLTITMVSGETVSADQIVIRGETPDNGSKWYELLDATPETADGSIRAGDSATVEGVEDGDLVQVVYESESTATILWSMEV